MDTVGDRTRHTARHLGDDVGDRAIVVAGFMRLAILEIRSVQLRRVRIVIIESLVPQ